MHKFVVCGLTAALVAVCLGRSHAQVKPPIKTMPKNAQDMVLTRAEAVVKYALDKKGQRVGGGECTDLVHAALAYARAKPWEQVNSTPAEIKLGYPKYQYVWGQRVVVLKGAKKTYMPGDILQFENCKFVKPDGTQWWGMGHHTAIVKSANGSMVTLIHQNAPEGGPVTELTIDLSWVQKLEDGKKVLIQQFRPMAAK
jgi:hypothetical protein